MTNTKPLCLRLIHTFATGLIATTVAANDWLHWRGPHHDGVSMEPLPDNLDAASVGWRAKVGIGFASISVFENRVFTMGNEEGVDTVWCLDAQNGEVIWNHSYDCPLDPRYYEGGPGGTPTIDPESQSVFTLSKKGHVFCLDLETGQVRWKRNLLTEYDLELPEWSFAGSPLVDGHRVILNVGNAGWALDKATGQTVWRSEPTRSGYATPVPFGSSQALIFSADQLVAVNRNDGKIQWRFPWESSRDVNAADPIVAGDRILISSSSGAALLSPPTAEGDNEPKVVWKNDHLISYFNPGVLSDGHVFAIDGTTHRPTELICMELSTGEVKWSESGFGSGALVAAGGGSQMILFDKGLLTIFPATPDGFQPRLRMQVLGGKCWTAPVYANGRIYCRNAEGDLACVVVE